MTDRQNVPYKVKTVLYSSIFGKVLWFDNDSGFGCIQYDMNGLKEEINVHSYGIIDCNTLSIGDYVKFDIVQLDKYNSREEAIDVIVVSTAHSRRNKDVQSTVVNTDSDYLCNEFEKEIRIIEAEKQRLKREAEHIALEKSLLMYGSQAATTALQYVLPSLESDSSDERFTNIDSHLYHRCDSSRGNGSALQQHTPNQSGFVQSLLNIDFSSCDNSKPSNASVDHCEKDYLVSRERIDDGQSNTSNLKRKPDLRHQIEDSKRVRIQRLSKVLQCHEINEMDAAKRTNTRNYHDIFDLVN